MPGPVTSQQSAGVHEHLRTGTMQLVTSGADVLELLAPAGSALVEPARGPDTARDRLPPRQRQVLDAVPAASAAGSESIARAAGLGVREVAGVLVKLQEAGFVAGVDHGWRLTELART